MDEPRVTAFRTLKPYCVEVSQLSLKFKTQKVTSQQFIKSLQSLLESLQSVSGQENSLDPKLADYVFFPLSHIFRDAKSHPHRAVEIALQCLEILISKGWRTSIQPEMGKQLVILLCFLAGGNAAESKVKDVNEEIGASAFDCLAELFLVSRDAGLGVGGSVKAENMPVLGHAVTVVLDGITEGPAIKVRLSAASALAKMIVGISDREALKNVFPGVVSCLTKMLSAKSTSRPSSKLLITGLSLLQTILFKVLGDEAMRKGNGHIGESLSTPTAPPDKEKPWMEATGPQVKMALANIMPLRHHARYDVRRALCDLCICIIERCRKSLHQSLIMVLESIIILNATADEENDITNETSRVLATDSALLGMLKSSLHDWIVALPRVMQSNDDLKKQRSIDQIKTSYSLLEKNGVALDMLNDLLASNLQASTSSAIRMSANKMINSASEPDMNINLALQHFRKSEMSTSFKPVFFSDPGSRTTSSSLQRLVSQIHENPTSSILQGNMVSSLRSSSGNDLLATMWLLLQLLSTSSKDAELVDQYIDLSLANDPNAHLLDEIYSFALSVLSKSTFASEDSPWQLQAMSLEALAHQARCQKADFRPELVDALYPILERLGSNNASLQQHAMTALNIVSAACTYTTPAALIIDNADYLVNAISLKLNTFDISPQAPQVLVMMIRLCGSALIPYLDDLVESIFSILACYHGYPKLVESLFSVLTAITEEAGKSTAPLIANAKDTTTRPVRKKPLTMHDLATILRDNLERKNRPLSPPPPPPPEESPFTPPLTSHSPPTPPTTSLPSSSNPTETTLPPPTDPPPPPKPTKPHQILTSITQLTPSHLTSPSPTLRASLLHLLATSFPLLAHDTDTFLPLAAQLYPYIATRLYAGSDVAAPPPFETLAAAKAMAALCHGAGDFLMGRVGGDFGKLKGLWERVEGRMREEVRVSKRGGGMAWRVWDEVVGLVLGVCWDVGVPEEDGGVEAVFEMLGEYVGGPIGGEKGKGKQGKEVVKREIRAEEVMGKERREEVRECLEELNADLLWLVQERGRVQRGGKRLKKPPAIDGFEFMDLDI